MGQMAQYLNRQILLAFLVVVSVFLLVAIGGRFVGYLQEALIGKYASEALVTIMLLRLPEFMQQLIPFAFFISIVFVFSRMRSDNELSVMHGFGVSVARLLLWISPSIVFLLSIVSILVIDISPKNSAELAKVFLEQRQREEFDGVTAGVFRTLPKSQRVTYTETISEDRQQLQGVFIAELDDAGPITIWADSGRRYADYSTGSQFLVLENGIRYQGLEGSSDYRIMNFGILAQRINIDRTAKQRLKPEAFLTAELLGSTDNYNRAELEWRISLPFLLIIGSFIAVSISYLGSARDNFSPMASGIALFLSYYLCLIVAKDLMEEGRLAFFWGNFGVHFIFLLLSIYLLRKASLPRKT
jgi:lipopolysaccharide export system permease protein